MKMDRGVGWLILSKQLLIEVDRIGFVCYKKLTFFNSK